MLIEGKLQNIIWELMHVVWEILQFPLPMAADRCQGIEAIGGAQYFRNLDCNVVSVEYKLKLYV
jgi:hypothetical protein